MVKKEDGRIDDYQITTQITPSQADHYSFYEYYRKTEPINRLIL